MKKTEESIVFENNDFTIIELKVEYKGWTGREKYAIISDFDPSYIEANYACELKKFTPYLFMNNYFLGIRRKYNNNNNKFLMRSIRSKNISGYTDSETEEYYSEALTTEPIGQWIQSNELKEALMRLSNKERERIVAHHIEGKTNEEIGEEYGCSEAAIRKSISKGMEKLKKIMTNS